MTGVNPQPPINSATAYQTMTEGLPKQLTPEQAVKSDQFHTAMQSGTDNAKKGASRYAHLNAGNILSDGNSLNAGNILSTLGKDSDESEDESES
jgi:hypothetical protein